MCPHCHREFPLTEAITQQIETHLKDSYEEKIEQLKNVQKNELATFKTQLEKNLTAQFEKQHEEDTAKIREFTAQKIKKEFNMELEQKDAEIEIINKRLESYLAKEKQLMQKEHQLEEEKHTMTLTFHEQLTKEIKKAYAAAEEKAEETYQLKLKEKEKIIADLSRQMKEGQRKAEQGFAKLQGEILELELEELLQKYFPEDEIAPIAPGKRGADIMQTVRFSTGKTAGTILWETKRTKTWQAAWIPKLKEDQRDAHAEIAVIASEVLPQHISEFGMDNGIWITDLKYTVALAGALRENLKSLAMIKSAYSGKETKSEMVYSYLTGIQFKQRVESILEAYIEMKDDLEQEKRAIEKSWAKREKQAERFIKNISGMYGDLQGIGASLQSIKLLEMDN
jgi:hypothetical protein